MQNEICRNKVGQEVRKTNKGVIMIIRDYKLEGMALCKAEIDNNKYETEIVLTYISVSVKYTPDWQFDAYNWHNEGWYDYDIENVKAEYPDEYKYLTLDGELKEGKGKITKILEVLKENLHE